MTYVLTDQKSIDSFRNQPIAKIAALYLYLPKLDLLGLYKFAVSHDVKMECCFLAAVLTTSEKDAHKI